MRRTRAGCSRGSRIFDRAPAAPGVLTRDQAASTGSRTSAGRRSTTPSGTIDRQRPLYAGCRAGSGRGSLNRSSRGPASSGRNDAQPTSMISPNVHMPRQAPMPTWRTTAPARTSGRSRGRQIRAQKESSQSTETWVSEVQESRVPGQPGHVDRLVFQVGERPPHGLAVPPGFALELGDAGEEIDDAHVDVDQPQRQVRAGAGAPDQSAAARPRCTASHRSIESACPLGPMARYKRQHRVDLIEAERRRRDPIRVRDRDQERQDRSHAGPQSHGEHRQHDHGERSTPATSIRRGPATRTSRCNCRPRASAPGVRSASSPGRRSREAPAPRRRACRGASDPVRIRISPSSVGSAGRNQNASHASGRSPRGILRVGNEGSRATASWEDPQFTLFVALGIVEPPAVADALHRRQVMCLLDQA